MLDEWLRPNTVDAFVKDYLRKQPYASPSTALKAVPIFGWDSLEKLLAPTPAADILVVSQGKLVERPVPRTLAEVRGLMQDGIGLVIRRGERQDAAIAGLITALTRDIPGEGHVQLFITPGGTHGFGWHYDDEDVFILQTRGVKDCY